MYTPKALLCLLSSLVVVVIAQGVGTGPSITPGGTEPFEPRCSAGMGFNGNGCQPCQAGTYSDGVTMDTCTKCPVNYMSGPKASSCSVCTAGSDTRSQTGSNKCQICDSGSAAPTDGSSCSSCDPGSYAPDRGAKSCSLCPPGQFTMDKGARGCQDCQAGYFNGDSGQTACGGCPKGYYTPKSGSTACLMCECGTFNPNENQSSCQKCPSQGNTIWPSPPASTSSDQCLDLKANGGFYYDNKKCPAQCPGGTYSTKIQSGSCQSCPAGKVSPVGSTSSSQCMSCPGTSVPNADKTGCGPAPSGAPRPPWKKRRESFLCPKGLEACPVNGGGRGKEAVFECIDISTNVESCGGCPEEVGGQGEDCTAFDERATASCVKGMCRYECPAGFQVGKKGCERVVRSQKVLGAAYKRGSIRR